MHDNAVNVEAPPPVEKEIIDPPIEAQVAVDTAPVLSGDAPKISYASIVKVMKVLSKATPVYVPTNAAKSPAPIAYRQPPVSMKPAPPQEASFPGTESAPENNNIHEEVEGHSIYVRNLPLSATVEQLQDEFKKFGPIKHDGIQVRSQKAFVLALLSLNSRARCRMHFRHHHFLSGIAKLLLRRNEPRPELVAMGEVVGGLTALAVVGTVVKASGGVGTLVEAVVMEGVSLGTQESFQEGGLGDEVVAEMGTSGLIKVKQQAEVDVRVDQTLHKSYLLYTRGGKVSDRNLGV